MTEQTVSITEKMHIWRDIGVLNENQDFSTTIYNQNLIDFYQHNSNKKCSVKKICNKHITQNMYENIINEFDFIKSRSLVTSAYQWNYTE